MPEALLKATTFSSTLAACANVAVIAALVNTSGVGAVQISAVPGWVLVRRAKVQVTLLPPTVAVWPLPGPGLSADTKATTRSDDL